MPDHASGKVSSLSGGRQSLLPPENLLLARGQRRRKDKPASPPHQITFRRIEEANKGRCGRRHPSRTSGKLPCHAPIVAVHSQICCPARLPVGDLTATHGDPRRPTNPQRRGQLGIVFADCIPPWQCGTANAQKPLPIPVAGSTIQVSESCPGRGRPRCCPALNEPGPELIDQTVASGGLGAPRG